MNRPPAMPPTLHAKAAWAMRHPKERQYVGRSVALSVVIHLFVAALFCLAAYWFDVALKDLLRKGGSIAASGPAPEQPMTVNLVMAETHPPPTPVPKPKPTPTPPPKSTPVPTPEALPVLPPIQPKMVSPVPSPASVPSPTIVAAPTKPAAKPSEKPATKPKPRYMAAHATGEGKTANISSAQPPTDLPAPNYPPEALALREVGTVQMEVVFGPDGRVSSAEVRHSSGFFILDFSTRSFIRARWKSTDRANTTVDIPIRYHLDDHGAVVSPQHAHL